MADDSGKKAPARSYNILRNSPQAERFLASKIGGFGVCGRPICCARWLKNANDVKVSIRMAKAQKISLSPENLNGYCCHLKCCLAFEAPPETKQPRPPSDASTPPTQEKP